MVMLNGAVRCEQWKFPKGSAKKFVSCEKGIKSWGVLQQRLRAEFHVEMAKRKRKTDESSRKYLYAMQEIAAQGRIEGAALIQHVIDGIIDAENNKIMLYEATTIEELKSKLKLYDRLKEKTAENTSQKLVHTNQPEQSRRVNEKTATTLAEISTSRQRGKRGCFNCGSTDHNSKYCPDKTKGPKCFSCNQFGHLASDCPTKKTVATSAEKKPTDVGCMTGVETMYVKAAVNDVECSALIDTGSDFNLIREGIYKKLQPLVLKSSLTTFVGLGMKGTPAIGVFEADVKIQGNVYTTKIYVLPAISMKYELIVGHELLRNAEVIIRQDTVSIIKIYNTKNEAAIYQDEIIADC